MARIMELWFAMGLLSMCAAFRVYGAELTGSVGSALEVASDSERSKGDGLDGEFITSTVKDEVNTVQINFHAIMPKDFPLGVCVEMLGNGSGKVYRILATNANDYMVRMYVPEGSYTILDCYVDGDNTAEYPMSIPSDFVAEKGKSYLLECAMSNLEEVEEKGRSFSEVDGVEPSADASSEFSESPDNGGQQNGLALAPYEEALNLPWRNIRHQGEGTAELFVEGVSKQRVELLVEITATGGYKKGEFRYSTDKGETWSDTLVIGNAPAHVYNTSTGDFTGLDLRFGHEEYLIYDVYALNTKIEYEQESVSNNGKGIVNFYSDDVIYDDDYSIVIKIVKTGSAGEGEFKYSLNGGFTSSEDIVVPAEGLFLIPDTVLWVEFFDNGGEFMVGDTYKTKVKGDMSKHDYTPYIAGLLVVVLVFMAWVYHHYASQKDRGDQYELERYERVK